MTESVVFFYNMLSFFIFVLHNNIFVLLSYTTTFKLLSYTITLLFGAAGAPAGGGVSRAGSSESPERQVPQGGINLKKFLQAWIRLGP